jgi:endogenous inhibitor of DNA gyrase (YacG/DUF329 family)
VAAVKEHLVSCPRCGKGSPWTTENAYRPFCSERCKLIDLGQWASESYRIPLPENQQQPPDNNDET